jgi:hypothetical protein
MPFRLIYGKKFADTSPLHALKPSQDHGIVGPNGKLQPLGRLVEGESVPPHSPMPSGLFFTSQGLTISVSHARGDVTAGNAAGFASRTLYLVTPPTTINNPSGLNQTPNIQAIVEFDSPKSFEFGTSTPSMNKWAVGLNVKDGDANDNGPADNVIGPTCQFHDGGQVRMNTDAPNSAVIPLPANNTYDDLASKTFTLSLEINRTPLEGGGFGRLMVGTPAANYTTPSEMLIVPSLNFAAQNYPSSFASIGIALVNAPGVDSTVSVRLKRFEIWVPFS